MSLIDTYRKKLSDQIEAHRSDIDALKARAKKALQEGKKIGKQELDQADKHLDQAKVKFNELRGASSHALADIKIGMKKALADLQKSSSDAAKHFNQHTPQTKQRPAGTVRAKAVKAAKHVKHMAKTKASTAKKKTATKAPAKKKKAAAKKR